MQNQPDPQTQDAAPPAWFQRHQQELANVLQNQDAKLNAIARASSQPKAESPKPVAPADPTPFRAQIHDRFLNEPERLFAETIAFAEQRADQKIAQTVQEMRAQMEQERAAERFWGEFYSHNPELQAFQAEVGTAFAQTDVNMDPSVRANAARDYVRAKLQGVLQATQAGAQRQQMDRRAMAGAPGAGFGSPERAHEQAAVGDMERTAKAVAERNAWRLRGNAYDIRSGDEVRAMKADRMRSPVRAVG